MFTPSLMQELASAMYMQEYLHPVSVKQRVESVCEEHFPQRSEMFTSITANPETNAVTITLAHAQTPDTDHILRGAARIFQSVLGNGYIVELSEQNKQLIIREKKIS